MEKVKGSLKPKELATVDIADDTPTAAVCAILRPVSLKKQLTLLLVKRNERMNDPWSGHMAFPGGRRTEADVNILATAAREVLEETGIDIRKCEILGSLDEVIPSTIRSVKVVPFVIIAPEETEVHPKTDEIERFFWIPVSYLLDSNNLGSYHVTRLGIEADVPCYRYLNDNVIWGMTFRIVQDLLARALPKTAS